MTHQIRQFENAVGMLVDGFLREDDSHENVRAIVDSLIRVAGNWNENLDPDEENGDIAARGVVILNETPSLIEHGTRECVATLVDAMGVEHVRGFLDELRQYAEQTAA